MRGVKIAMVTPLTGGFKMKTRIAIVSVVCALSASAAWGDSFVGTWSGELTDTAFLYPGPTIMDMVVTSESGTTLTGHFDWISSPGDWAGCASYPCTGHVWKSGTITGGGTGVDIIGIDGYNYVATLSGDTLSGTFLSPSGHDFGDWSVTRNAPEPATLSLLGLGLAGIGFARRARKT
jgi:hypothetical protein